MPAQSQQQQKLFGLALSVKRGETPRSDASADVLGIVDSMTEKEIEDFASTSHKGLPKKVEQQIREMVREIMRERAISEMTEGKKRFRQQDGVGKAKYTISYHDGKQKHKDGSDFFGIQIFKNKKDLETFRNALLKKGYIEESVNEAKIYKVIFAGMQEKDAKDFFTMVDRSPKIKAMTKDSGVFKVGNEVTIRFGVSSKQELEIIKKVAKLEGLKIVKIDESVNEGIEPQIKKIAYFTGTRPEAVEDFVSKHALNITKLLKYVEKGGLPQRMELVSALAGRPNNPTQKKIIKMFNESINEGYSTEEKRIVMMAVKKLAKYRNVPLDYAINDLLGAGQELERDIKKGKIK